MILTSNLPFTQWASALADDQTLTAAMLDRGAAPRAHRADQRRQLPAQGQAQGRNTQGAEDVLIRGPGGSMLLRRSGRKVGQNYVGVDRRTKNGSLTFNTDCLSSTIFIMARTTKGNLPLNRHDGLIPPVPSPWNLFSAGCKWNSLVRGDANWSQQLGIGDRDWLRRDRKRRAKLVWNDKSGEMEFDRAPSKRRWRWPF